MELNELKDQIEYKTGIPSDLLTGNTADEILSRAKSLLAYRESQYSDRNKSNKEHFADWLNAEDPELDVPHNDYAAALAQIEERYRIESGGYPKIGDNGSVDLGEHQTAKESFSDWFTKKSAYDPFMEDGWKPMK